MTQRFTALGIATTLALGILIGAWGTIATRPQLGEVPTGSAHAQMLSGHAAAMMSGGMMSGGKMGSLLGDMGPGPGTGFGEHHQGLPSAIPD